MRVIKKIFNNNIVNAVDDEGDEVILVGAGVGYSTQRGHAVDESKVEREFHLTGQARSGAFRVLLEIPYPVLRATSQVSIFVKETHGLTFSAAAELGLANHLSQAVERANAGLPIHNSMLWETKMTYPAEFAVALQALEIVHSEIGIKLPLDEAGFITLHLVNAGFVGDRQSSMMLSTALRGVVDIVEHDLDISLSGAQDISRFLTHVKFVIQRLTRHRSHSDVLDDFMQKIKAEQPALYGCAVHIGEYLTGEFGATITEAERMYLVIHLLKLRDDQAIEGQLPRTGNERG